MRDLITSTLIQGSAVALPLRDVSVQCVVTSPPYWGLRSYDGEQQQTWGDGWRGALGLEPTPDLYVEHIVEIFREVRRVLRPDGTLWLVLGDSYAQKDLVGIPWRVAFALQADGWWLRSDIVWSKPNPMPEPVTDRPTKAHEYVFLLTKSTRYFYDADAIREAGVEPGRQRNDRIGGANGSSVRHSEGGMMGASTDRNARTVWTIATQPYPGAHFATFPEKLAERCILAGSAPDDVILDPFNGSGTAGRVAIRHGRSYVGIDISREYLVEQATKRTTDVQMEAAL